MNSFTEWLKVVLAVALLALLVPGVFFYLIPDRRALRAFGNLLKTITALSTSLLVLPSAHVSIARFPGRAGHLGPHVEEMKT
jgi:hypothetical protein